MPMHGFLWRHALFCGSVGLAAVAPLAMAGTTVVQNAGSGTNRIEVTGNSAQNVQVNCAAGPNRPAGNAPAAHINSVEVDGKSLQGKTVIVTGRNTHDVRVDADCQNENGTRPSVNVNSVNIR